MVLVLRLLSHMPLESDFWDFPGGPVVKTLPSNAGGVGSITGQQAKTPHALWPKKKTETILQQIQ